MKTTVLLPAFNEEPSIALVLNAIPRDAVDHIIVIDNGSTDATAEIARQTGARVVHEPRRGYGSACLRGIAALPADCECVVFLDADFSDHPEELPTLVEPIANDTADLVIGSRMLGQREPGALLPQAYFGNKLACFLIWLFWRYRYTDLGPFRAVRRDALERLRMKDTTFGWTVEMQVRALQEALRVAERPVSYRNRVGRSKITGTINGTVRAGYKILATIAALRWKQSRRGPNVG